MKTLNLVYILIFSGLCFFVNYSQAQIKIGDNHQIIQSSSLLELESTNKGVLIPRMNSVQRDLIPSKS